TNGMLVILTPQAMTDPTQTAEELKTHGRIEGKPVLASWMGGSEVSAGEDILNRAGIPTFEFPDDAAQAFNYMWRYAESLRVLYERPGFSGAGGADSPDRATVEAIIQRARDARRTVLTEAESKQILAAYGIPTIPLTVAATEDDAVRAAADLGYPTVLKLHSETITHKTDVGGVQLNLADEAAVRRAFQTIKNTVTEKAGAEHFLGVAVQPMERLDGYELIVGSSIDAQFGPVLLFGTGGTLVEVYKDRALALPPLSDTLARRMMQRTKIYKALEGVRGRKSVDMAALERLMVHFSQLVVEQGWIKEIDINPLLASSDRLLALDARVVLHDPDTTVEQLPKLAIRPYPYEYAGSWTARDGAEFTIRPIRPEDEPAMVRFHENLSERTVYLRYLQQMQLSQRVGHDRMVRICFADYDREIPLVVEWKTPQGYDIIGVARLSKVQGVNEARWAIVIADRFQGKGLGTELLRRMIDVARAEKVARLVADMSPDNVSMRQVFEKFGFKTVAQEGEGELVRVELALS
ncbi:MAG: acetyl CoA synthetase subunit alpha, partial [Hydrogenophilales bacterium CG_4_10_14_3_um_filter_63_21]